MATDKYRSYIESYGEYNGIMNGYDRKNKFEDVDPLMEELLEIKTTINPAKSNHSFKTILQDLCSDKGGLLIFHCKFSSSCIVSDPTLFG